MDQVLEGFVPVTACYIPFRPYRLDIVYCHRTAGATEYRYDPRLRIHTAIHRILKEKLIG